MVLSLNKALFGLSGSPNAQSFFESHWIWNSSPKGFENIKLDYNNNNQKLKNPLSLKNNRIIIIFIYQFRAIFQQKHDNNTGDSVRLNYCALIFIRSKSLKRNVSNSLFTLNNCLLQKSVCFEKEFYSIASHLFNKFILVLFWNKCLKSYTLAISFI